MIDELQFGKKRLWYNCVFFRHFPGGTEENHENTSAKTAGVLADIRTEHLPNNIQELYGPLPLCHPNFPDVVRWYHCWIVFWMDV
jgi:hypothetical protein